MNTDPGIDGQLLRGLLDTLVLDVLRDRPNYGFGILEVLHQRFGAEAGIVKEATLYPLLHRLEARGFLLSYQQPGDRGQARRYYRLTETGKDFLGRRMAEWKRITTLLERMMS